ncbi:NAD(+) synthase [Halobaculum litoreum]|uniref:NH(3)-dependent NAD(+) synthetase n=1 Tax=Halobaculum litoreum TaxID=3031998 RepID=A0ABD5XSP0_9EURY
MAACYFVANADDRLVVGTSNRTERLLGYFTKHGDGGADVFPLGEYDKGEVRALAAHLGVPEPIREKRPTAGFWDGQTDEADLGAPYETLDEVVAALADGAVGVRAPDTVAETVDADPDTVVTQAARIRRTGHKRERPPAPGRPEADIDATADTASGDPSWTRWPRSSATVWNEPTPMESWSRSPATSTPA